MATAAEAADAAAKEARRVIREKKWDQTKDKVEDAWDSVKARFKSTFSSEG